MQTVLAGISYQTGVLKELCDFHLLSTIFLYYMLKNAVRFNHRLLMFPAFHVLKSSVGCLFSPCSQPSQISYLVIHINVMRPPCQGVYIYNITSLSNENQWTSFIPILGHCPHLLLDEKERKRNLN